MIQRMLRALGGQGRRGEERRMVRWVGLCALLCACATGGVRLGVEPRAINQKARACDDFFEFACGDWIAKTEIPSDRPAWHRGFSELSERNQDVLRAHLER